MYQDTQNAVRDLRRAAKALHADQVKYASELWNEGEANLDEYLALLDIGREDATAMRQLAARLKTQGPNSAFEFALKMHAELRSFIPDGVWNLLMGDTWQAELDREIFVGLGDHMEDQLKKLAESGETSIPATTMKHQLKAEKIVKLVLENLADAEVVDEAQRALIVSMVREIIEA